MSVNSEIKSCQILHVLPASLFSHDSSLYLFLEHWPVFCEMVVVADKELFGGLFFQVFSWKPNTHKLWVIILKSSLAYYPSLDVMTVFFKFLWATHTPCVMAVKAYTVNKV